jgi:tetratricopeptide (TPR) repeat protein
MAMVPLRGIFSKLFPKLLQTHDFGDVLTMYNKGDLGKAYIALCNVMKNETRWSKDGDVYTLWAELELLANHDPRKALEFLEKAQNIGCSEMGYYYNIYAEALWEAGEHEKALQYFEKSVATDPTVSHLRNLAWALSLKHDKRAMDA